jgi:ribosomal protein L11 methyltransferase
VSRSNKTYVARLTADEAPARRVAALLGESLDAACSAFAGPDGRWQVAVHFPDRPDERALRELVALAAGEAPAAKLSIETIAPRDWVEESLAGLKPVRAGRFTVHGAHDRAAVGPVRIGIEVEAALAFGTGHHGTTRGCLLALDALARLRRPRRVLDLGTGTGVLAIAAAKLWPGGRPVLATDIDAPAVRIARANAARNRVGPRMVCVHAAGLTAPAITQRAPFDLVLANILLAPLTRLAAPMRKRLGRNAVVVLSGLLAAQKAAALAAYRSQGLVLERSLALDGWVTLVMRRPRR